MPKATKTKIVKPTRVVKTRSYTQEAVNEPYFHNSGDPKKNKLIKPVLIGLLLVAVLALGWNKYKNRFVVATVNGKMILRSELNQRLMAQYGTQTLEGLIGEKIIFENGNKQKVVISQKDIDDRIAEIEKSLGGMKLDEALKLQGMTRADFVNRQKIQLTIDRMFNKDISVSATEVDEYINNNSTYLTASEPAQKRIEAETAVKNTKIEQKFMEWFNKTKEEAKIFRFL